MEDLKVIKYPLSTEKAIRMMESENKLGFIVDNASTKSGVKKAVEKIFKVKVEKVNMFITHDGKKKAYVKLSPDTPAIDVATQLGLM